MSIRILNLAVGRKQPSILSLPGPLGKKKYKTKISDKIIGKSVAYALLDRTTLAVSAAWCAPCAQWEDPTWALLPLMLIFVASCSKLWFVQWKKNETSFLRIPLLLRTFCYGELIHSLPLYRNIQPQFSQILQFPPHDNCNIMLLCQN